MPNKPSEQTKSRMDAYLDYSYKPNSIGSGTLNYKRSEFVEAYRRYAILRNYIDLFSSEATRYFPSLFGDVGEEDANELKVIKRLRDVQYIGRPLETFNWQSFWQMAFLTADLEGNCYVIIGMEGQEDTSKELQPGKLKWLALKHIDEISPNTMTGTYSLFGGGTEELSLSRVLHKTRVIKLHGTKVPGYNRDSFIHDDSLLAPLLDEYMKLEATFCNVAEMIAQHSFFHLAISGLTQKIVTKGASLFSQRLDKLMEGIKNMGGLLSDKDKEDATVITRNYGGLDNIIEKNIDWFVAQTGLPKSIILNMHSQGSLSDGTKADLAILNNIIARYQSTKVAPAYSVIFDLITQELGLPEYDLKFKPTYPTDAFVQAQIDKLKAETEAITNGTVSLETENNISKNNNIPNE